MNSYLIAAGIGLLCALSASIFLAFVIGLCRTAHNPNDDSLPPAFNKPDRAG